MPAATDKFSSEEVQRILGLNAKQLDQWERMRLITPRKEEEEAYYDFRDLIGLRTVKQLLENGVPANRLQRAVDALREKLSKVESPLAELRVLSDGKDVVIERDGARLEPLSGQFVLNFEIREIGERVRVIAQRTADDWFNAALAYESDARSKAQATQAYDLAVEADPRNMDALLNGGTLAYESGQLEKACDYFRRAVDLDPENALAHFNLGSALDETGQLEEARQHLRQAVQLDPKYPDAHYNLAYVCEKLRAYPEARQQWQAYVQLDPTGEWAAYARHRLASTPHVVSSPKR
jgi:tetratricopeptide (TPR) repeat protein